MEVFVAGAVHEPRPANHRDHADQRRVLRRLAVHDAAQVRFRPANHCHHTAQHRVPHRRSRSCCARESPWSRRSAPLPRAVRCLARAGGNAATVCVQLPGWASNAGASQNRTGLLSSRLSSCPEVPGRGATGFEGPAGEPYRGDKARQVLQPDRALTHPDRHPTEVPQRRLFRLAPARFLLQGEGFVQSSTSSGLEQPVHAPPRTQSLRAANGGSSLLSPPREPRPGCATAAALIGRGTLRWRRRESELRASLRAERDRQPCQAQRPFSERGDPIRCAGSADPTRVHGVRRRYCVVLFLLASEDGAPLYWCRADPLSETNVAGDVCRQLRACVASDEAELRADRSQRSAPHRQPAAAASGGHGAGSPDSMCARAASRTLPQSSCSPASSSSSSSSSIVPCSA